MRHILEKNRKHTAINVYVFMVNLIAVVPFCRVFQALAGAHLFLAVVPSAHGGVVAPAGTV